MKTRCYIYGAGKYGKVLLSHFIESKEIEVIAFIDKDIDKQNKEIQGVRIISLEEMIRQNGKEEIIFVSLQKGKEIKSQLQTLGFTKVFFAGSWIQTYIEQQEYFTPKIQESTDYINVHPFNHYESPYPDITEIHYKEAEIFDKNKEVLNIDFNITRQFEILKKMEKISLPGWSNNLGENNYRYYYNNIWFGKGSADALYYMLRIVKPKRIIEIGSGYSTSAMLDINETYFENTIQIISIEPRADRLKALLRSNDNLKIYEINMQEVSLGLFSQLERDDFLFVDSSHVSKINSDVNRIFFEILPRLRKGVYVHFHDIFYPFIYPRPWVYEGRAYGETYLLRAFLMNNSSWSIQFFGDMLEYQYKDQMIDRLKGCGSGSIWLRREK